MFPISFFFLLGSVALYAAMVYKNGIYNHSNTSSTNRDTPVTTSHSISELKKWRTRNRVASTLPTLIRTDGAGAWPPRTDYEAVPVPIRPFITICEAMISHLAKEMSPLNQTSTSDIRNHFRATMQRRLSEEVNLTSVIEILAMMEGGDTFIVSPAARNAIYCTLAILRHAFRWAIIPVSKETQDETVVHLPLELNLPWAYLQRSYGCSSDGGNLTSNILLTYDQHGQRKYRFNAHMAQRIQSTDDAFVGLFRELEKKALPIYTSMAWSIISYEQGQQSTCLSYLQNINCILPSLLQVFKTHMHDAIISRETWLPYSQGFQAWAAGHMIDGEFVKDDGVSANQLLLFQAVDAFLDIDPYLSEADRQKFMPAAQRALIYALRTHSLRRHDLQDNPDIENELKRTALNLKAFRVSHLTRAMPYLRQPAPERRPMTAAKSVWDKKSTHENDYIKPLEEALLRRVNETQ